MKILYAEDDEDIREIVKTSILNNYKTRLVEFIEFDNGRAALEYFTLNRCGVDLILTDNLMPGMTGTDLVYHVRTDLQDLGIPIIMHTTTAGIESSVDCIVVEKCKIGALVTLVGELLCAFK